MTATVTARRGADPDRVRSSVLTRLQTFLDPLIGGPAGLGWPFGRDVYRAEILQQLDIVPGVDHVDTLELVAAGTEPWVWERLRRAARTLLPRVRPARDPRRLGPGDPMTSHVPPPELDRIGFQPTRSWPPATSRRTPTGPGICSVCTPPSVTAYGGWRRG